MPENNGSLAEAVRARIAEMGWSQTTIASRGGPSTTSITKITSGQGNLSPRMLAQIDAGMDWPAGRAAAILAGKEIGAATADLSSVTDEDLLAEVWARMKGASCSGRTRPEERSPRVTPGLDAEGAAVSPPPPPAPNQQSRPGGPDRRRHQ